MEKKLINLTPHAINLIAEDNMITTLASQGVARVTQERKVIGQVNGFPINHSTFGMVTDLPESKEDTIYIVSALVAQAAKDRNDLLIVDQTVRDDQGRIIGCKGFAKI